ncbi:MAG: FAD-dependent oxidoreductase, partial [Planctomycetota bacterium]|nr:FAD-dependent oxidoreductase [Planctomycetota bacterium]
MSEHIAIVGAGLSGLLAARELSTAGHRVRVFDKARGPGGRMATRRRQELAFDHGAQYVTIRDRRFRQEVDTWLAAGVAAPWAARLVEAGDAETRPHVTEHDRYVGVPRRS